MPEIHFVGYSRMEYETWKPHFDRILRQLGLEKDAVTIHHGATLVESCDGERLSMPYLHIFSSEEEHIPFIIKAMASENLYFDITWGTGGFIDKEGVKKSK